MKRHVSWFAAGLVGLAACASLPEEEGDVGGDAPANAPEKVGDVLEYGVAPPAFATAWRHEVIVPDALFVRVHLGNLALAPGESVTVSSPDGSQKFVAEGRGPNGDGDAWAFAIDGDIAIVEYAGGGAAEAPFIIREVGRGTLPLGYYKLDAEPEVVCGTEGREDVACYPALDALQKPVARLLFTSGGGQYLCTGWLVRGASASTMLTNNHCMKNQAEVSSLEARFNYQYASCGGSSLAGAVSFNGGTFLKTDRKLDYTLLTVAGNPEAQFGEVIPTRAAAAPGNLIYFIQHPAGRPKEIGYYEDETHTTRCAVSEVNRSYSGTARKSQMSYGCDSEGGSSGSPILRASDGKAIGLHHFGGVGTLPCLNAATQMSNICQAAGSLLSCDAS